MRWTVVAIASGVVLGGAVLASRALLTDPELPPAPPSVVVSPAPAVVPPAPSEPRVVTPTPPPLAPTPVAVAPEAPPPPTVASPTVTAQPIAPPPPTEPQPDDVEGPWAKNSRELAYAESLLAEEPPVRDRVLSAHGVFERCLTEQPDNERCSNGVRRANLLLKPTLPKGLKQTLKPFRPPQSDLLKGRGLLQQP